MTTTKMNFTLPLETVERLKVLVSDRERSGFVARAIEEKLRALEAADLHERLRQACEERREEEASMMKEWEHVDRENWPPYGDEK